MRVETQVQGQVQVEVKLKPRHAVWCLLVLARKQGNKELERLCVSAREGDAEAQAKCVEDFSRRMSESFEKAGVEARATGGPYPNGTLLLNKFFGDAGLLDGLPFPWRDSDWKQMSSALDAESHAGWAEKQLKSASER